MKPLEGVRILAVSQYGAGPYATLHLADLGAEVIKIEDRRSGGDVSRSVIPYAVDGDSLYFQTFNRNKKSITLDLKSPRGQQLFHQLVEKSDVAFNNLRGDVPNKLGLTYATLGTINPRIVTCSLSGYGTNGSMAAEPAYDYLMQAQMGHMSLTGEPGGPPEKYGISLIDFTTGIMAALGIMVGLFQAQRKGHGCELDVTLFDTSVSLLNYLATWNLNKGYTPTKTRNSAHPSLVPSQLFKTADGYMVVMCNKEKFFPALCRAIGAEHLGTDPRFTTFAGRLENKDTLLPQIEAIFAQQPSAHWTKCLAGIVPTAPVNTVEEGLKHPLVRERNMIVDVDHPTMGPLRMVGSPIKIANQPLSYTAAPTIGQHNKEIFGGLLGLSDDDLQELEKNGVI